MQVKFLDLLDAHSQMKTELIDSISKVIDSSEFILGATVEEFEKSFAAYCGTRFAIGVNSGTSALHLALLACGVGPGDEVITTPSTFVATVSAIVYTGATPVFVDTNPDTWTIDETKVERAISKKTKAILPVHLHGRIANMEMLISIAEAYDLKVVEDSCQAHGAERGGLRSGQFGDMAAFSFYPGKNLGALGEAGAVVTANEDLASRVRHLRNWGSPVRYVHDEHAFNFRMDGIQGAVLSKKLQRLDAWNLRRSEVAKEYDSGLDLLGVTRPVNDAGTHAYHIYGVLLKNRDLVMDSLTQYGVQTAIHYPIPVHLQKAYHYLGYRSGDFPEAERLAREWLSLPMGPHLTSAHTTYVLSMMRRVLTDI